jgi:hypothetical protein
MSWKFEFSTGEIAWSQSVTELIEDAMIDFGNEIGGDLEISLGDRTNEISIIDQGFRVIERN